MLPTDSGGRVSAKITAMGITIESKTDSGFEKNVVLSGEKVHEKWTTSDKQSETAFFGDRFMV